MSWLRALGPVGAEARKRAKRTASVLQYIFPSTSYLLSLDVGDPLTPAVDYSLIIQVGRPKAGKTTSALTIAWLAEQKYGEKLNTYTILSYSLPTCISKIPEDAEVATLIVDDAPVMHPAFSGRRLADAINVASYFMVRHLAARKAPGIRYVIMVFNTQRFWSLDVVFREASDMDIFKSIMKEPREQRYLKKYLGAEVYRLLKAIHKGIFVYRDPDAYNYFVYYTTWGERNMGYFASGPQRPKNLIVDTETKEKVLEQLLQSVDEAREIMLKQSTPKALATRDMVVSIIENLGRMGVKWSTVQKKILPMLRESGLRIRDATAYKAWAAGRAAAEGD